MSVHSSKPPATSASSWTRPGAAPVTLHARQAINGEVTTQNQRYLHTKANRHGHWLHELLTEQDEPASTEPERLPAPGATSHP